MERSSARRRSRSTTRWRASSVETSPVSSICSCGCALAALHQGRTGLINFVSNLPKDLHSGGFSAMSAAAFAALSKAYVVHYAGPINPSIIVWQKALSKFLRLAGAQGDFFFFSQRRLEAVAREVCDRCRADCQCGTKREYRLERARSLLRACPRSLCGCQSRRLKDKR